MKENDIFEKFAAARQADHRLHEEEKSRMRRHLRAFMTLNPVREAGSVRLLLRRLNITKLIIIKDMAIALLIVLMVGGGTSFAAQDALPGDILYPVKIGINEEVHAALAFSAEADARWEVERASRRLEEAEQLAMRNRLDAQAEAAVAARFERHADRAREIASSEKMKKKGSVVAAKFDADFEASLRGHEKVLAEIAAKGNVSGSSALNLVTIVRMRGDRAAEARVGAEADVRAEARAKEDAEASLEAGTDTKAAAEGKRGAFKNKIAEVRAFMGHISASTETRVEAEARLAAAEKLAAEGSVKLEAGAYADAFAAFKAAFEAAQEAKAFLVTDTQLKTGVETNVREGIDVDAGIGTGTATGRKTKGSEGLQGGVKLKLGL